jgi:hypothetical protein
MMLRILMLFLAAALEQLVGTSYAALLLQHHTMRGKKDTAVIYKSFVAAH